MNILIDLLPTKVEIDSKEYEINSNFRTSLLFSLLMEDDDVGEEQKIIQALNLYYPTIPADINKAIEKIIWFYKCGKEDKKASSNRNRNRNSTEKVLDYNVDADYIYSAFMSQYNIDLQDIEYLHWWKFRALFDSLDENNRLSKIIQYRSMDLSKIKDKEQKKFYKNMKKLYKIDTISEEEKAELEKWNNLLK